LPSPPGETMRTLRSVMSWNTGIRPCSGPTVAV
jgi:hypothetical protein